MPRDLPPAESANPPRPVAHLNKLRIAGFKSFVDPIDLSIEPGLTGIVGPNGCGKSNLIEALRWVMGESSARQMRGGEMDDVIFSGTVARPARDVAEVVIELSHLTRTAPPLDGFESLEISRRIERARGSTYRVNGKEVRARDVHLLLADSATGARSTAIVSQGQVGSLIAARPQERRVILEEAAGITGLHSRRHEADIRLRSAETNLERLDDVVATLEAQHQGLSQQARQAGRYRALSEQIRATELRAYALHWQSAGMAVSDAHQKAIEARAVVDAASALAADAAAHHAAATAAVPDMRRKDAETAADLQRLTLAQDGLDAEERRIAADQKACRLRLDQAAADVQRERILIADADAALAHIAAEKSRIEASQEGEAMARSVATAALASISAEVDRLDADFSALTAARASADTHRSAIQRRIAELDARGRRLAARAGDLAAQRTNLERQRQGVADLDATAEALAEASAALDAARAQAASAEDEKAVAAATLANAVAVHQDVAADHARLHAEEQALAQVLALDSPAAGLPVVDMLSAQPGLEAAVAAALGDDLLAPLEADAPVYWRTLAPMDVAPPLPCGVPPLAAFVNGSAALERRLGQIGLVSDDAEGERLQPALACGQRLVTRVGGQWRWDGLTANPGASSAATRLRQRNRLQEVREQSAASAVALAGAAERLEATRAAADVAMEADKRARAAVQAAETACAKAREVLAQTRERLAKIDAQYVALDAASAAVQGELAEMDGALAVASAERAELPDPEAVGHKLTALRRELAEMRAVQTDRRLALDALMREAEERRQRLDTLSGEAALWTKRRAAACQQLTTLEQRHAATMAECEHLAERPAVIEAKRAVLLQNIEAAAAARRAASDQLAAGEARLAETEREARAAASALTQAREDLLRAEAAVEQAEAARQSLAMRIGDALGIDPQQLDALDDDGKPQANLSDLDALERRLERMRREREAMGPVNLRAEEEARELASKIKQLVCERRDLIAAISKLRQGLAELDGEGRERLLATFTGIDQHFRDLFVRLFGGGHAHLALTESEDPLDAGLEIMASPPGKRLQALSLLSGGEQALATLALIFAVFLIMPAPICVLDEVDAPLDDANVDRLCALLADLTERSATRFLIVTHHRTTMARMNRLYGVTMAEKGVSQLVSVDLMTAEQLRETA